jgi:hypothetical protein
MGVVLNKFTLPVGTYQQEEFYPIMVEYFLYGKNYNSNLLQFAKGIYQAPINSYIVDGNSYIDYLIDSTPTPYATPWNLYNPFRAPPTPPTTTGWPSDQIEIVNAITSCLNSCYNVANDWISFILANELPPQTLTDQQCWNITLTSYLTKLIKQYQDKPVASKSISYYTYWYLLNVRNILDMTYQFNPWFARGLLLDFMGSFFGLNRNISFEDGIGNQYVSLTDEQFRIVIFFHIAVWKCNFSYLELTNSVYSVFKDQVNVSSKQDMNITYYISATLGSDMYVAIYAMLAIGGLPAPLGVLAKFVTVSPINKPFFAVARASEQQHTTALRWGLTNISNNVEAFLLGYGNFIVV